MTTRGTIGLWQGTALYVCAILGAGALILPGQVASLAGPASLFAWAFSIALSVPLAFTFAGLASTYPDAGGVALYAGKAFGEKAGAVAGWWYFVAGSMGQTIVPLTAGYYLADATGLPASTAPAFALAVLAGAAATALAGTRVGGRVQVVLAAGVCVVLTVAIVAAVPQIRWNAFTPFLPHGTSGVGEAVVVLFFAFSGWEAISHLSAEFTDPRRTLPRATLITLIVVAVLYLGIAFAVVGTNSYGSEAIDHVSLARVVSGQFGVSPAVALAVAATVICVGTSSAFMASISHLGYALGRDGLAPGALARVTARGVPSTAVLAVAGTGAAGLAGSAVFGWGTGTFVYIPSTLVLTTYLMAMAAGLRLLPGRRKILPGVGLLLILAVTPSAGWHLVIPLGIAATALTRFPRRYFAASANSVV